ncbi:MAG TPA: hypothetical protein VNK04_03250 [Gemmataceae bacterium]|nr:hypothetical protein [Gemmataceae bacterium]
MDGERIATVRAAPGPPNGAWVIDLHGGYLVPGYVDLHVHGGAAPGQRPATSRRAAPAQRNRERR